MNTDVLNYIEGRVTTHEFYSEGEVVTHYKAVLDNDLVVEGRSVLDINSFDRDEAQKAAKSNAIASLYPGVSLALAPKVQG